MENSEELSENKSPQINEDIEIQYIISTKKFIILSIFTFGYYPFWWSSKIWRFFRQKDNLNIMPAMRASNDYIYVFSLFSTILKFAKQKGYTKSYSPFLLGIGCIFITLMAIIPFDINLFIILKLIFMIPPFKAISSAMRNSTDFRVVEQSSFNRRQKVLLFFGGFYWLMIILAILLEANFI